jgi:hypothetical protein
MKIDPYFSLPTIFGSLHSRHMLFKKAADEENFICASNNATYSASLLDNETPFQAFFNTRGVSERKPQ